MKTQWTPIDLTDADSFERVCFTLDYDSPTLRAMPIVGGVCELRIDGIVRRYRLERSIDHADGVEVQLREVDPRITAQTKDS